MPFWMEVQSSRVQRFKVKGFKVKGKRIGRIYCENATLNAGAFQHTPSQPRNANSQPNGKLTIED